MHATICLSCLHTGIVGPVLGPEFGSDVPRCKPVAAPGESFLPAELLAGSVGGRPDFSGVYTV